MLYVRNTTGIFCCRKRCQAEEGRKAEIISRNHAPPWDGRSVEGGEDAPRSSVYLLCSCPRKEDLGAEDFICGCLCMHG